ncbi:MAG: DUF3426 domain-containing protein [Gammaproteobacteria bacterium]|nr:DUF3426 domain-containing protein [Gammaproteobacteria bacterium]
MKYRCPHCRHAFRITTVRVTLETGTLRCLQCQEQIKVARGGVLQHQRPATTGPYALTTADLTSPSPPASATLSSLIWVVAILLSLTTMGWHYLYFQRHYFVQSEPYASLLQWPCRHLGCQLPPRSDLKKIAITRSLIRLHPEFESSLLITATLANGAKFAQPYPLLEVKLTDISGQTLAQRRFPPALYLDGEISFAATSQQEIELEVVIPNLEQRVVGFELKLLAAAD